MNKFVFSGEARSSAVGSTFHILMGMNTEVTDKVKFLPTSRLHWVIGNPDGGVFCISARRENLNGDGWECLSSFEFNIVFDSTYKVPGAFYEIHKNGGRYTPMEIVEFIIKHLAV